MPASDNLLSAFVAEWEGKVSRSCIDNWLAGLSFWHTLVADCTNAHQFFDK